MQEVYGADPTAGALPLAPGGHGVIDTESQRRLAASFRRAGVALPLSAECELMAAEIDRLRAEVVHLRALNVALAERCHGQSELLAQRAEGDK